MKTLHHQFQNLNTRQIFNRSPEGVDVPTEPRATRRIVNPEAAAAAVGAHGVDLTAAVNRLPGSSEARALAADIEARVESGDPLADLTATLEAFGQIDFTDPDNPNLFTMFTAFTAMLDEMGIDLSGSDESGTTGGGTTGRTPGRSTERTPNSPGTPEDVDIPENLNQPISPEDMALMVSRCSGVEGDPEARIRSSLLPMQNIALAVCQRFPNVRITSPTRSVEHNNRLRASGVDAAQGSDHTYGAAFDFVPASQEVADWANQAFPGQVWADNHDVGGGNHLHISYRPGGRRVAEMGFPRIESYA